MENWLLVSRCTRSLPVLWIPAETKSCTKSESSGERDAVPQTGDEKVTKNGPWCEERIIYMKAIWRFLSDLPDVEVMADHEIYEILHKHKLLNILEHVTGGDVEGGRTRTQEFVDAAWLCVKPRISPFQHYRLVHRIVGHVLFKFECTKQLVMAILDALKGVHILTYIQAVD